MSGYCSGVFFIEMSEGEGVDIVEDNTDTTHDIYYGSLYSNPLIISPSLPDSSLLVLEKYKARPGLQQVLP